MSEHLKNETPEQGMAFSGHRYEQVVMQDFRSTIPPHLLAKLPEDERFLVEAVSRLENQFDWTVRTLIKVNGDALDLHSRVNGLEKHVPVVVKLQDELVLTIKPKVEALWDWKQFFSGKWAVLAVVGVAVLGVLLKVAIDLVLKLFKL